MIEWKSGRDARGHVQKAGDKPAYARSVCGRYLIARVMTKLHEDTDEYDWRSEVSYLDDGVAVTLGVRLELDAAIKIAEEHADGLARNGG